MKSVGSRYKDHRSYLLTILQRHTGCFATRFARLGYFVANIPLSTFPDFPGLWLRVGVALFPQIGAELRRRVSTIGFCSHLFHQIGAFFTSLGQLSQKHLYKPSGVLENFSFLYGFRNSLNWEVLHFLFHPTLHNIQKWVFCPASPSATSWQSATQPCAHERPSCAKRRLLSAFGTSDASLST